MYISFSGGKDSTVLRHLVKEMYPNVLAVFADTGLEYPEVREFARENADEVLKPKMKFNEVIAKYGYPVISKEQSEYIYEFRNTKSEKMRNLKLNGDRRGYFKISEKWKYLIKSDFRISHYCCDKMKKNPFKQYEKVNNFKPIIGTMAEESMQRMTTYIHDGCNAFNAKRPTSKPLSVWTEQDILQYISTYNIPYASVYGEIKQNEDGKYYCTGAERTGCIFCAFGAHLEDEPTRFQRLKKTHPKLWNYCIEGGNTMKKDFGFPRKKGLAWVMC